MGRKSSRSTASPLLTKTDDQTDSLETLEDYGELREVLPRRRYDPVVAAECLHYIAEFPENCWEQIMRRKDLPNPATVKGWITGRMGAPPIQEFARRYEDIQKARLGLMIMDAGRLYDSLDDPDITKEQVSAKKVQAMMITSTARDLKKWLDMSELKQDLESAVEKMVDDVLKSREKNITPSEADEIARGIDQKALKAGDLDS